MEEQERKKELGWIREMGGDVLNRWRCSRVSGLRRRYEKGVGEGEWKL